MKKNVLFCLAMLSLCVLSTTVNATKFIRITSADEIPTDDSISVVLMYEYSNTKYAISANTTSKTIGKTEMASYYANNEVALDLSVPTQAAMVWRIKSPLSKLRGLKGYLGTEYVNKSDNIAGVVCKAPIASLSSLTQEDDAYRNGVKQLAMTSEGETWEFKILGSSLPTESHYNCSASSEYLSQNSSGNPIFNDEASKLHITLFRQAFPITFNAGAGTGGTQTDLFKVDLSQFLTCVTAPSGKGLIGWQDQHGNQYDVLDAFEIDEPKTFTAIYGEPIAIFIGQIKDPKHITGPNIVLPTAHGISGYSFLGWAATPDATEPTWMAETNYNLNGSNTIFYAVIGPREEATFMKRVTDWSEFNETDDYIFAVEDGDGGSNMMALFVSGRVGAYMQAWTPQTTTATHHMRLTGNVQTGFKIAGYSSSENKLVSLGGSCNGNHQYPYFDQTPVTSFTMSAYQQNQGRYLIKYGSRYACYHKDVSNGTSQFFIFDETYAWDQFEHKLPIGDDRFKKQYDLGTSYSHNYQCYGARVWTIYRTWNGHIAYAFFKTQNGTIEDIKGPEIDLPNQTQTPCPAGATIDHWACDDGKNYMPGEHVFVADEDKTFTAVYRMPKVFFNGNVLGVPVMDDYSGDIDALPVAIPNNPEDYTFVGWATSPDAKAPTYLAGQPLTVDHDIYLYAVYSANFRYYPLRSVEDLQNGDKVVFAVESGSGEEKIIAFRNNNAGITSENIYSQLQDGYLTQPGSKFIYNVLKDANQDYYQFYYDSVNGSTNVGYYYLYSSSGYSLSNSKQNYGASWTDVTSKYYLEWLPRSNRLAIYDYNSSGTKYRMSMYSSSALSYAYQATSTNLFDQIAQHKAIADYACAITLFKKYPTYEITFDAQGGTTSMVKAYAAVTTLPTATKDGATFVGWTDDGSHIYKAGERYPEYSCVAANTTLTAVYTTEELKEAYVPVTDFASLHDGDTIFLVMEDGTATPSARYGLQHLKANAYANILNTSNISGIETGNVNYKYQFVLRAGMRDYDPAKYSTWFLRTPGEVDTFYYYYSTTEPMKRMTTTTAREYETRFEKVDDLGHIRLQGCYKSALTPEENLYYYISYMNAANYYMVGSQDIYNQFAENTSLETAIAAGQYPNTWTIYRKQTLVSCTVTYDAGTQGTCATASYTGYKVDHLPAVTCNDPNYFCTGWSDGVRVYPIGSVYCPSQNVTLTAQYARITTSFDLGSYATWLDGTTTDTQIQNASITLPKAKGTTGYRFLGWSTKPYATSTIEDVDAGKGGATYHPTASATLYAVVEPLSYQKVWELADVNNPLQAGDSVMLFMQDGCNDESGYVLYSNATSTLTSSNSALLYVEPQQLKNVNALSGKYKFLMKAAVGSAGYFMDWKNGYLYPTNDPMVAGPNYTKYEWTVSKVDDNGHYTLRYSSSNYLGYGTETKPYYNGAAINQHNPCITLQEARNSNKYPNVWTFYRPTDYALYYVTLQAGDGTGSDVNVYDYKIDLQSYVNQFSNGNLGIISWYDAEHDVTYQPNDKFILSQDITLTAQYGTPSVYFEVGKHGNEVSPVQGTTVVLPSCKAKTGYRFLGWSTTEGGTTQADVDFAVGSTYPTSGTLSGNALLYAVIEEVEDVYIYSLVTSLSEMSTIATAKGQVVLTMQDGGNGTMQRAMSIEPNCVYLQEWHPETSTTINEENKKFIVDLYKSSSYYNIHRKVNSTDYYWYYSGTIYGYTGADNFGIEAENETQGRYIINAGGGGSKACDKNSYYTNSTTYTTLSLQSNASYLVNQFTTGQTLTEIMNQSNKYPYIWTIYKVTTGKQYMAMFNLAGRGSLDNINGPSITLPSVAQTPHNPGEALDYWEADDNEHTHYNPGQQITLTDGDITFTAYYRPSKVFYHTSSLGTCSETDHEGNVSNLPACTPTDPAYTFVGWTETENGSEVQYSANEALTVDRDIHLYAVYSANYRYYPIASVEDIQDGNQILITAESGKPSAPSIMAIQGESSSVATVELYPNWTDGYITNPDAKTVYKVIKKDDYYQFYHYQSSNNRDWYLYSSTTWLNATYQTHGTEYTSTQSYYHIEPLHNSNRVRIYDKDGNNKYYMSMRAKTTFDYVYSWNSTYQFFDQVALQKELAQYAYAITIYKYQQAFPITFNADGGNVAAKQGYAAITTLPTATKQGYNFIGWTDDNSHIYKAGERYPEYGCVPAATTLTAVYSNQTLQEAYVPVADLSTLRSGDTVVFVMQDGTAAPTARYGLQHVAGNSYANILNTENISGLETGNVARKYQFILQTGVREFDDPKYTSWFIRPSVGGADTTYYFSSTSAPMAQSVSLTRECEIRFEKIDDCGHIRLTGCKNTDAMPTEDKYNYIGYKNSANYYMVGNQLIYDQFAENTTLSAALSASKYPNTWTLYRKQTLVSCTVSFEAGDKGTCDVSPITANKIDKLPAVTRTNMDYYCDGWSDGAQVYPIGGTYYPTHDVTLTAHYVRIATSFDLGEYATWMDETKKDSILYDGTITLPNAKAVTGYRFLGWSTIPGGDEQADVDAGEGNETYHPAMSATLYAVVEPMAFTHEFRLADESNPLIAGDTVIIAILNGNGDGKGYALHSSQTSSLGYNSSGSCSFNAFDAAERNTVEKKFHFNFPNDPFTGSTIRDQYGNAVTATPTGSYINTMYSSSNNSYKTANVTFTFTYLGQNGWYSIHTTAGENYKWYYMYYNGSNAQCYSYNVANQFDTKTILPTSNAASSAPYPYVWTIYRLTLAYHYRVALLPGEGMGERVYCYGEYVTLPTTVDFVAPDGKFFNGFKDNKTDQIYQCGQTIKPTEDMELTAVYTATPMVSFNTGAHGSYVEPVVGTSVTLPAALLSDGYRFAGWAETQGATTATYHAGDTYPATGTLSQNTTLYVVETDVPKVYSYELVTSVAEFKDIAQVGDSVVLTLQDGDGGPVIKALRITNGHAWVEDWKPSDHTQITAENSKYLTALTYQQYSSQDCYYLHRTESSIRYNLYGYSSSDIKGYNTTSSYCYWRPDRISEPNGRYSFYNAYSGIYLSDDYSSSTKNLMGTGWGNGTGYVYDQYDKKWSLVETRNQKYYPGTWTVYRATQVYSYEASFITQGTGHIDNQGGPDIQLPSVAETPAPVGQALDYWTDANGNRYEPEGHATITNSDMTYTANYRTAKLHYIINNGTCAREDETYTGEPITLPTSEVTADAGYRFMGWSSTPNSSVPDVSNAGSTYEFDKETYLYAVVLNTQAWVEIKSFDEVSGKNCLFVAHGYSLTKPNDYYALNFDINQTDKAKAVDLTSHYRHGVLIDAPSTAILKASSESQYYYDYSGTKYYLTGANGSGSSMSWSTSSNSGVTGHFTESTKTLYWHTEYYSWSSGTSYFYATLKSSLEFWTYSNTITQQSTKQTIQEVWDAGGNNPRDISLWKPIDVDFIYFDLQGGTCADAETGYGVIESLPWASKDGYRLYGWNDGEKTYQPGERYPETGFVERGQGDVTLTAVFRHAEITYDPIASMDELSNNDSVLIVIADGTNEGNKYAMKVTQGSVVLTPFDPTNVDESLLLGYSKVLRNDKECATFRTKDLYYLDIQWGPGGMNARDQLDYGWWYVDMDADSLATFLNEPYSSYGYYLAYKDAATVYPYSTSLVNQYDPAITLAQARTKSTYPYKWRIYKRNVAYTSTVHFEAGTLGSYTQGDKVATNVTGVTLPDLDENTLNDEYVFLGWFDGADTLAVGSTYKPNEDITLIAVYERKQAYFNLQGHGTWVEDGSADTKAIAGVKNGDNYEVTVPALNTMTPNYGYRFLGWSLNKDAQLPTYTGGETINVNTPQTLYAVYSAAYVFRLITKVEDLADGDSVVIAIQGGDKTRPQAYALPTEGDTINITKNVRYDILSIPEYHKIIYEHTNVASNKHHFSYTRNSSTYLVAVHKLSYVTGPGSMSAISSGSGSSDYYKDWTLTWLSASKRVTMYASYYCAFSGSFYAPSNGTDQIAERTTLKTTSRAETGCNAVSIFKKYPLYILTYDCTDGTCDRTFEYGGSESLPEATPSDPNTEFVGWTDGTRVYKAGTRFPETDAITQDMTLTAIFKESATHYEKITDISQINDGDILIFCLEDGDGGTNRYGLYMDPGAQPWDGIQTNRYAGIDNSDTLELDSVDAKFQFVVSRGTVNNYFYLYNKQTDLYLSPVGGSNETQVTQITTSLGDGKGVTISKTPDGGNHFYLSNNVGYKWGYNKDDALNMRKMSRIYNQYTENGGLGYSLENGHTNYVYAEAWTIYRKVTNYSWIYTFDEGEEAKGVLKDSERMKEGISITLPTADAFESMQDGWSLRGWTDGIEEYKPGSAYSGDFNTTFHAVYETYTAHFVIDPLAADPIENKTGTFTIPAITPNEGYRFSGWSLIEGGDPNPDYAPGIEITLTQSLYLYAVTEQMATCDKYVKTSTREQNVDYIIAFEDGDGGQNGYAMTIKDNSFRFDPLNLQNPDPNHIFRVNSNTLFFQVETGKKLATSGGTYSSLSVDGGFGLSYEQASNGGWQFSYTSSNKKTWLTYSGSDWVDGRFSNVVDQWNTHQSLQDVVSEEKGAYNITLYKRTTGYAYRATFVTTPSNADIPYEEGCEIYLPDASAFSGEYATSFMGWAITAEKAALREIDYLPGAHFAPTQDITLYAVFAYIPECSVLEWSANGVTIETDEPVTAFQMQVGEQTDNDAEYVDKNIYQLSTPDLSSAAGQTLTITFEGQDGTIGSVCITIPTIVTSDISSASLSLTNTSDVVVLNNAKLTMAEEETVNNVTIMGGGKLVVPENVMLTANHIYLKGGHASATNYQTYEYIYPQLAVKGSVKIDTIFYDYLLNKKQQYTFAVPMPVKRSDIKAANGEDVTFKVAEYDGAVRAQGGNGWGYTDASTFEPGKGYTIFATPLKVTNPAGKLVSQYYVTVRMPMVITEGIYTENESRAIQVTAYPSGINPTLSSWNLVGVPFMCNYSGTLTINDQTQEYVTIPDDKGTSYINYETDDDETILPAFKNFFVQAAATGSLVFDNANRQTSAPWRRMENLSDAYRTGIILSQGDLSDRVGLLLGDIYTDEYEINADLDKWMNAELSAYAIVGGNNLAYAAIDHDMAAKEIPIGYKTTQAGACTFSLNSKYDASLVQAVWLTDYETGDVTNLLWDEYVFTTKATTDNTRFALTIIPAQRQTPTDINQTQFQRHGDCFDILGRRVAPNQRRSDNIYIQDNHKFIQH